MEAADYIAALQVNAEARKAGQISPAEFERTADSLWAEISSAGFGPAVLNLLFPGREVLP